jgi:hypothetical protein
LALEKAKEDYQRRYNASETQQARKDRQRLEMVRIRRAEAEGRKPGFFIYFFKFYL